MSTPGAITVASVSAGVVTTTAAHGLTTGHVVGVWVAPYASAYPSGLARWSVYYVNVATTTTLTLHATAAQAAAGTSAITFTIAGGTTLRLARLTVRERILRDLHAALAAVSGVNSVSRFDAERGPALGHLDVVIIPDDDQATQNSTGRSSITLPVFLDIHLQRSADEPETYDELVSRWIGLIEAAAVGTDRDTFTRHGLATSTRATGHTRPPTTTNQPEVTATVDIEIEFRHLRGDPFTSPDV